MDAPQKKTITELLLGSSVAAACVTVIFGTFGASYILQSIQRSAAERARAADQRAAVITGQLDAIEGCHAITAEFNYVAEFVLFDITESHGDSDDWKVRRQVYTDAARTFISESSKKLFQLRIYFGEAAAIRKYSEQRDEFRRLDGKLAQLLAEITSASTTESDEHRKEAAMDIRTDLRQAFAESEKVLAELASHSAARRNSHAE